jgi:hypothetical protein
MRNPCLEVVLAELRAAGIRRYCVVHGGKHVRVSWLLGQGLRVMSLSATPELMRLEL